MSDKWTSITVEGEIYFERIQTPDAGKEGKTKVDSIGPSYQVSMVPNEESMALCEEKGVRFKEANDHMPERHINPRSYVDKCKAGEEPIVVDADKQPWTGGMIGNGSRAKLRMAVKDGLYGIPKILMILDHVPYEGGDSDGLDDVFNNLKGAGSGTKPADTVDPEVPETTVDPDLDDDLTEMMKED